MRKIAILATMVVAAPLHAEDKLRDLCADRPGLDMPACTVDPGHVQVEVGLGDWTLDRQPDSRTDTFVAGDVLLRYGVGDRTEVRLGWTAFGHVRVRDRTSGEVDRTSGVGDITVGLKQDVSPAIGGSFAAALLPYASLPVGRADVGAGDWGAGLLIPLSYNLSETLMLELTPEIDAAVDGHGHGRHLAYGSAGGFGVKLSETVSIAIEAQLIRDRDPEMHSTQSLAGLSLGWQPKDQLQLDMGGQAGLNRSTPDVEVYFGVTRKF